MTYYIIENQHRPDGQINNSTTVRNNFATALSYYHERYSKMVVTNLYTKVSLLLVDENLKQIQHDVVNTLYVTPVENEETENSEEVTE